jgi:hypothetical protein
MGAAAFLETKSLAVNPGEEAAASIRVRNTGQVVDQFTLSVLGDAQPWATVEPPTLSLFPGAEGTATVTFRPPKSAEVPAGPLPFGIRVDSKEDPAGDTVEEGSLEVGAFIDTYAELAPRTSRGSRAANHDLAVDNRGNLRLNAQITASDPDKALDFDINPPSVVADPGTAALSKVKVKPRKRFWRGTPKTHPFRVEVLSPGAAPVGVDGTMLQEQALPSWTVRALLAVLAIAVIGALLWAFFLQPTIAGLARQELIAAGATVGPSGLPVLPGSQRQEPAGGGGGAPTPTPGGGGGGGTPTPTTAGGGSPTPTASLAPGESPSPTIPGSSPSPTLTLEPGVGPGGQRAGRLQGSNDQFAVDPVLTLYVTDLIFNNPSDTLTGQLIVGRRDLTQDPPPEQPLLILQLQNFRDIDYHFVTPLLIPPGQALFLGCPGGCDGVSVLWSGYQR